MTTPTAAAIVLVEDDANDVLFVREAIERAQIANPLMVFSNAAEARLHFTSTPAPAMPVLFVLDLDLGGADSGIDLLAWIRDQPSAALGSTPAMILTGSNRPQDRVEAERLGSICFLQKPISQVALTTAVKALGFVIVTNLTSGAMGFRIIARR